METLNGDSDIKLSRLEQLADLFDIKLSELIDMNEKAVLNLAYKQNQKNWQINSNVAENMQLKSELEKQQFLNEQKDKELAMQQREIAYLKELNELLKKQSTLME